MYDKNVIIECTLLPLIKKHPLFVLSHMTMEILLSRFSTPHSLSYALLFVNEFSERFPSHSPLSRLYSNRSRSLVCNPLWVAVWKAKKLELFYFSPESKFVVVRVGESI